MAGTVEYPLSNGGATTIDSEDYEKVSAFGKWYKKDNGYAVKKTRINGKNVNIRMHRLVMDAPEGLVVDHINGDKLDNRKSNLRCVSQQINSWNMTRDYSRKYDLPKGISFDKSRNQYVATKIIRRRFNTMEEAANFVNSGRIEE